jgi:hypothetical protein
LGHDVPLADLSEPRYRNNAAFERSPRFSIALDIRASKHSPTYGLIAPSNTPATQSFDNPIVSISKSNLKLSQLIDI